MSWPEAFAFAVGAIAFVLLAGFMLGAITIDIEFKKGKK